MVVVTYSWPQLDWMQWATAKSAALVTAGIISHTLQRHSHQKECMEAQKRKDEHNMLWLGGGGVNGLLHWDPSRRVLALTEMLHRHVWWFPFIFSISSPLPVRLTQKCWGTIWLHAAACTTGENHLDSLCDWSVIYIHLICGRKGDGMEGCDPLRGKLLMNIKIQHQQAGDGVRLN